MQKENFMSNARIIIFALFMVTMQVILEVSPEALYNEILTKIFSGSLYDISSNDCGSFVVQALISSARGGNQVLSISTEVYCLLFRNVYIF